MTDDSDLMNQPPPRGNTDLWSDDPVLSSHAGWAGADTRHVAAIGPVWGAVDLREVGRAAERHAPEPNLIDRSGRRLDEVSFHPAYHRLLETGLDAGYSGIAWDGSPGGHATHAAMVYLMSQVEPAVCCPMTMTYAAVPALSADADLAAFWRPKLTARAYDPRILPATKKEAVTMGMAMTERPGGSDVRSNVTRAVPDGDSYFLTGHKWFCSAPMSDAFLTLAQTHAGLTCFLVPRWLDQERNAIRIDRLKDKLGNRASASAEIAFDGARAYRLGEDGQGIRTIIEMVHHTRLDTAIAPAGLMRAALAEAHHWIAHRSAFQRRLIDQPLMRALIADLVLDFEGAAALALRVAAAFDRPDQRPFARITVALAKFLNNKLCPAVIVEAMEVLGGMGYVEDTPLPMLYREAPLNGIWEGSGNVICLDILRTMAKEPAAAAALRDELAAAKGTNRSYDTALDGFDARWKVPPTEDAARAFSTDAARLLTASVLIRQAPDAVADGYAATRLSGARDVAGTSSGLDTVAILDRLGPPF